MNRKNAGPSNRQFRRNPRRNRTATQQQASRSQPKKRGLLEKVGAWFKGLATNSDKGRDGDRTTPAQPPRQRTAPRPARKPEAVTVTSPRIYVGNLSYDATESDLFELFRGVGEVQNAEVVTHRKTQRSKGFGFVQMRTIDEARRAVAELHDKEFLGRKLVVSGAKAEVRTSSSDSPTED